MNIDITALKALESEKNIPFEALIETISTALLTAYRNVDGHQPHARIDLDRKTGIVRVMAEEFDADGNLVSEWDDIALPNLTLAELTARSTDYPTEPLPDVVAKPGYGIPSGGSTGRSKIIVMPGAMARNPAEAVIEQPNYRQGQVQLVGGPPGEQKADDPASEARHPQQRVGARKLGRKVDVEAAFLGNLLQLGHVSCTGWRDHQSFGRAHRVMAQARAARSGTSSANLSCPSGRSTAPENGPESAMSEGTERIATDSTVATCSTPINTGSAPSTRSSTLTGACSRAERPRHVAKRTPRKPPRDCSTRPVKSTGKA